MFKVYNKDTRKTSLTFLLLTFGRWLFECFLCFYAQSLTQDQKAKRLLWGKGTRKDSECLI